MRSLRRSCCACSSVSGHINQSPTSTFLIPYRAYPIVLHIVSKFPIYRSIEIPIYPNIDLPTYRNIKLSTYRFSNFQYIELSISRYIKISNFRHIEISNVFCPSIPSRPRVSCYADIWRKASDVWYQTSKSYRFVIVVLTASCTSNSIIVRCPTSRQISKSCMHIDSFYMSIGILSNSIIARYPALHQISKSYRCVCLFIDISIYIELNYRPISNTTSIIEIVSFFFVHRYISPSNSIIVRCPALLLYVKLSK